MLQDEGTSMPQDGGMGDGGSDEGTMEPQMPMGGDDDGSDEGGSM